jgi:MoaA/NifB/PqqE/SkfB family radical SAM enzyme
VLSLDGIGKKHDEARGVKGNFEKFLKAFSIVKPLREKYPNLSVKVHTVITNKNCRDLDEIVSYVKKLGPDIHTFDFVRGDVRNQEVTLPPARELKEIVEKIKSVYRYYAGFRGMGIHSRLARNFSKTVMLYYNDLFLKMLGSRKQIIPCYAGEMNAVIDPYGNVSFCEMRGSFGNLRKAEYDFKKIWNSPAAEKQRSEIKTGKCSCYHPCYQFVNIMFNPLELAAASRYLV